MRYIFILTFRKILVAFLLTACFYNRAFSIFSLFFPDYKNKLSF